VRGGKRYCGSPARDGRRGSHPLGTLRKSRRGGVLRKVVKPREGVDCVVWMNHIPGSYQWPA
jgi:hypothetical protein